MYLKMTGLVSGEPVIINTSGILRMSPTQEKNGTVIVMQDGNKILVSHNIEDICRHLVMIDMIPSTEGE